jgi:hypothetical protein
MVVIGAIMIVTIVREGSAAAIRMWAAIGTLSGLAIGGMVTYFFGAKPLLAAKDRAIDSMRELVVATARESGQAADEVSKVKESFKQAAITDPATEKVTKYAVEKLDDVGRTLEFGSVAAAARLEDINQILQDSSTLRTLSPIPIATPIHTPTALGSPTPES